ncbi:hypothetical protein F4677DRAFT_423202 [Hypoxylon crocopeplum]|nr:hypothetical protein F4677DRAFT_423202 [Hypoxylon crocopeplum]
MIFSKVLDHLIKDAKSSSPSSQSIIPKIYLGGLPIPPSQTLPGSLLVHLTEHQLQPIEELMGLPDHYRISSRSYEKNMFREIGLFEGQHGQAFLNAVIRLGESRDPRHDDIRSVRSLNMKMRQTKDF